MKWRIALLIVTLLWPTVASATTIHVQPNFAKKYGTGYISSEIPRWLKEIGTLRQLAPTVPLTVELTTTGAAIGVTKEKGTVYVRVNGDLLADHDFRHDVKKALWHYYDYNEQIDTTRLTAYWGSDYSFFWSEGAALYGTLFPPLSHNRWNKLQTFKLEQTKAALVAYATGLKNSTAPYLYETSFTNFNELRRASQNNYGVALSFVDYVGPTTLIRYGRAIAQFDAWTAAERDALARLYLGGTERDVLQRWLGAYPAFAKTMTKRPELTTLTIDKLVGQNGKFYVSFKEWLAGVDLSQLANFQAKMAPTLTLVGNDGSRFTMTTDKKLVLFQDGALWKKGFAYRLTAEEARALREGVRYTVEAPLVDATYRWIVPADLYWQKQAEQGSA